MVKSITLRLPKDEYDAFDAVCIERGYSKTGKIREFIRNMVKEELQNVSISAGEWKNVTLAVKEMERGDYASFEGLKRDFAEKKLANKRGSKQRG